MLQGRSLNRGCVHQQRRQTNCHAAGEDIQSRSLIAHPPNRCESNFSDLRSHSAAHYAIRRLPKVLKELLMFSDKLPREVIAGDKLRRDHISRSALDCLH